MALLAASVFGWALHSQPHLNRAKRREPVQIIDYRRIAGPISAGRSIDRTDAAFGPLESTPDQLRTEAERDPKKAIDWALQQSEPDREKCVCLITERWAEIDPVSAFTWLIHQPLDIRQLATDAIATGIASHPNLAAELGTKLETEAPTFASAFNGALIGALSKSGEFVVAQHIASAQENGDVTDWEYSIFRRWAATNPAQATIQSRELPAGSPRDAAMSGLIEGWAERSPRDLAAYALNLAPGGDRSHALDVALLAWDRMDPAGLADWASALEPGPVKDAALSLAVATTDSSNCSLNQALGWVDGISDPAVRLQTLRDLVLQNQDALISLRSYLLQIRWLSPLDAADLLRVAATSPRPERNTY